VENETGILRSSYHIHILVDRWSEQNSKLKDGSHSLGIDSDMLDDTDRDGAKHKRCGNNLSYKVVYFSGSP
jgi:hypothetical protein